MTRIAIVGGGISGLSAAFAIEEQRSTGKDDEYVLYESSSRLGGVLRTERIDGCLLEAGPDSFLTEKPWAADLCRALGIEDQLIGSNDAARKTYILTRGRLVEMPDGLMFMVPTKIASTGLSPLFSWKTKLRMTQELFHPPHAVDHDESVATFIERHYGSEMVDRIAEPLLSGVYGGDVKKLSLRATLPRFAEMERAYGSLGRAFFAAKKLAAKKLAGQKSGERGPTTPLFTSLKDGMQSLADSVVSRLVPSSLIMNTKVESIQPQAGGWLVSAGMQSDVFDAVIVALPAQAAGQVLRLAHAELSTELAAITYSSSITINLGYDLQVRQKLPPGFGFLIPRSEGKRLLAATFVHNKFSHRVPDDRALLRCAFTGAHAENVWDLTDDEIVALVRAELRQILCIQAIPLFARVYKWKSAMAQYEVGHLDRLDRIERLRATLPGLALAGNGYRGIGVPDCVRSGSEAAKALMHTVAAA
jgi:protoporphyrinogen/coproporphyrinogen III oxidase